MLKDAGLSLKILSPRIMTKAIATLDKATAIVVSVCWLAALIMLVAAIFNVHSVVAAKKQAADAVVAEPVLPVANTSPISPRELQIVMDRLQHQFPDIKFDMDTGQGITIRVADGSKFHQWITALSYVDALDPQFRWAFFDFCVGHCGQDLMKAVVTGQKVVFSLPQQP